MVSMCSIRCGTLVVFVRADGMLLSASRTYLTPALPIAWVTVGTPAAAGYHRFLVLERVGPERCCGSP